jgi:hypothetical protein
MRLLGQQRTTMSMDFGRPMLATEAALRRIDPTAANLGAPSGNYSDVNIVLTISY